MKKKIENPHIFISYAWGTEEYQRKVNDLATSLSRDGIDVEFDKWSLKEGNDTYKFMEKTVNDPTITHVLLLLDKNYEEKANARKGGVGTETQIISPEIYNKVDQEKFLPVVFEKGPNGEVYKPSFLKGLFHFDLADTNKYKSEYKRLVRRLFGIETFEKPSKGNPPAWLTVLDTDETKNIPSDVLAIKDIDERNYKISEYFSETSNKIIEYKYNGSLNESNALQIYKELQKMRDLFLFLIKECVWLEKIETVVSENIENLRNGISFDDPIKILKLNLIHEIFIYVIAIFLNRRKYKQIGWLLSKTYFDNYYNSFDSHSFLLFYSDNTFLSSLMCKLDKKHYFSGIAELWMNTFNLDICMVEDFILADVLLYNHSSLSGLYKEHRPWFALSYVYIDYNSRMYQRIASLFKSRNFLKNIIPIFGFSDVDAFVKNYKQFEEDLVTRKVTRYRYPQAFYDMPLLIDYINSNQIGSVN